MNTASLCLLIALLWRDGVAQECLQGADTTIPFADTNDDPLPAGDTSQAIITTYQFQCCGEITQWQTYVRPDGGAHQAGALTMHFQVWRPTPTSGGDCYSLVGENNFTSVMFADGEPVRESPQSSDRIEVRPGDVLGYFSTTTNRPDQDQGIQLDRSFTNDRVFFAALDGPLMMGPEACPVSVGPEGALSSSINAAPVFSVDISNSSCPPLPPPIMMTSSSTPVPQPSVTPTPPPQTTAVTDGGATVTTRGNSINAGLIAGLVVVVLVLIVAAGIVITIVVILRRSRKMKKVNMNAAGPSEQFNELLNPNYDCVDENLSKQKKPKPEPPGATLEKLSTIQSPDHYSTDEYNYPTVTSVMTNEPENYYASPDATSAQNPPADYSYSMTGNGTNDISRHYSIDDSSGAVPDECYSKLGPEYGILGSDVAAEAYIYSDPIVGKIEESAGSTGWVVPSQRDRKTAASSHQTEMSDYNKLNFFEETHVYWAPGFTTSEIYDQLSSKKFREISRKQITVLKHLGSGQFGDVSKGMWNIANESIEIAIKQLLPNASSVERVKLLQEAAIMGQFSHPNVVKLYGLVTLGDPLMVCIEFMNNGDLRNFIESLDLSKDIIDGNEDVRYFFLRASTEIAAGMKYLSGKSFIHRDLAARNILLNDSLTCKVGDFGMARDLMDDTYYTSQGGSKIPVKWTAPEALLYKKYSPDSDVWSYAMLLFEIWTVGKKPYTSMSNHSVMRIIESGYCQPPPPGCPRAIYRVMVDCWNPRHQYRPNFAAICNYLQQPACKLLYWSPNDSILSPQVEELGAPLENTAKLYPDLQDKYKKRLQ